MPGLFDQQDNSGHTSFMQALSSIYAPNAFQKNQEHLQQANVYQALIAKGIPEADARAAALNPQIMGEVSQRYAPPKLIQQQDPLGLGPTQNFQQGITPGNSLTMSPLATGGAAAAPGGTAPAGYDPSALLDKITADKEAGKPLDEILANFDSVPNGKALKEMLKGQLEGRTTPASVGRNPKLRAALETPWSGPRSGQRTDRRSPAVRQGSGQHQIRRRQAARKREEAPQSHGHSVSEH